MIEKGTIMESEAEPSSKELLKIYDTALAEKLMQKLLPMIENCAKQTRSEKVVVAVSGRKALENYLGTEKEINFEEVNRLVHAFKAGGEKLWVRHMGREETELWYEEKDFTGIKVLLVEWTHSNSDYYSGVDIPIYLDSTPQETLQSRLERNRDQWIDNPFTMMVLDIEQKMLKKQAEKAKLIVTRDGTVLDRKEYAQFVPKLQK